MRKSSGTHPPRVASLAPDVPHSDAAGIRIACGRTPYATLDARAPQDTPSAAAHIVFQNQRDAWIAERRAFSAPFPNSVLMKDGNIGRDELITCEKENRRRFPRAGLRLFAMQSPGRARPALSRAGNGGGG